MKEKIIIVLIFLGIIGLGVAGFLFFKGEKKPEETKKTARTTVLPLEQRPYITLTPSQDGHWLTLEVTGIHQASSLEYELLYNTASGVPQGSTSSFDLQRATSYSKKILLGSESSGKFKYDEGVTGGTLTLRLRDESGVQKYESAFELRKGSEIGEGFGTEDGNFMFEGSGSTSTYYLVLFTAGTPKTPPGTAVGGPYGIFSSDSKAIKGDIKLRLATPSTSVKIIAWSGSAWEELTKGFETDGEVVSVSVTQPTTFIAVTP